MYKLIKEVPGKYTVHSLKEYYNIKHPDSPCTHDAYRIEEKLCKLYGDEIYIYLATGLHSSEEYKFYQVLKFYIPEYICKIGEKFILDNGNYIIYDFIIGSRLLIEYDSTGKFHSTDENRSKDKIKEEFALSNGYKFLRLTKNDISDTNTINKIKKLLEDD